MFSGEVRRVDWDGKEGLVPWVQMRTNVQSEGNDQ